TAQTSPAVTVSETPSSALTGRATGERVNARAQRGMGSKVLRRPCTSTCGPGSLALLIGSLARGSRYSLVRSPAARSSPARSRRAGRQAGHRRLDGVAGAGRRVMLLD